MSKPEPERTCVGCRTTAPKPSLIRVVRSTAGDVGVDPTGRAMGRGAYVHPVSDCVRSAVRSGALGRTLRAKLPPERAARLMQVLLESVEVTS